MQMGALTYLATQATLTYFAGSNLRLTYAFTSFTQTPIVTVTLLEVNSNINRQETQAAEIIAVSKDEVTLRLQRSATTNKSFGTADTAIFHMVAIGQGV
jgi:hypothetical protein